MKLIGLVTAVAVLAPLPAFADEGGKAWSIDVELAPVSPDSLLFRGDGRSPDVIFKEGFQPRGANGDLGQHQVGAAGTSIESPYGFGSKDYGSGSGGGLEPMLISDSAFVSTTRSITAAADFAGLQKGALYVIRDAKGVDVNATFGSDTLWPGELEIAVLDGVRPEQIVAAWLPDKHGRYTIYVPNPGHQPSFRSTDPVVAIDPKRGAFYDARNGRLFKTEAELKDAQEREMLYAKPSPAVRLIEKGGDASVAILNYERAGKYGAVELSVGGAAAEWSGHASVGRNGVQAGVNVSGRVTVVEVNAKTKEVVGTQASVRAFVGVEAEASANAEVSRRRVVATGKVGVFHGAKVTGTLTQDITVCGVSGKSTVTVDASWGTGADAKAYFAFDWTTGTVKAGGHASASLDPGVGFGQEFEVSIEKLLRNPKGALTCGVKEAPQAAWRVTQKGASTAASLGKGGVKKLKKLCIRCGGKQKGPSLFVGGFNGDRAVATGFQPPRAAVATETFAAPVSGSFFRP